MKIKQLFEKLIENWPVKAVCLMMAIFLYIFNQQSGMTTNTIKTNLIIGNENGFTPAEVFNTNVAVTLRGKSESISSITEKNITAYLDFSYVAKGGKYEFPVLLKFDQTVSAMNPMEIKVTPEKITLKVEEEISGYAKIEPLLKGEVPHGYQRKSVVIEPEQVKIRGARSLVENCKSLQTATIVLSNATTSFSGTAKIENLKKNISLETDKVSYTVEVEEISDTKTLSNVPLSAVNLSPELEVKNLQKSVSFSVKGKLLSLEKFTDYSSVCKADFSDVKEPGKYDVKLLYSLPFGIYLDGNYPKTVSVSVSQKKISDEKEKTPVLDESGEPMEKIEYGGEAQ